MTKSIINNQTKLFMCAKCDHPHYQVDGRDITHYCLDDKCEICDHI